MRLIICGSREYNDPTQLNLVLTRHAARYASSIWVEPLTLVHGACPTGADALVDQWFEWKRLGALFGEQTYPFPIRVERHPADWTQHGKAAGPIRNTEMAKLGAARCIAFLRRGAPNGGTLDMMHAAQLQGICIEPYES